MYMVLAKRKEKKIKKMENFKKYMKHGIHKFM
jgi:hypothetical protein